MLDYILSQTASYLNTILRAERKAKGQFFTSRETAEYMAGLFTFDHVAGQVRILDPGAGTGILSAALIERLQMLPGVTSISLTCYETDTDVLPILRENIEHLKLNCKKKLDVVLIEKDYLLSQTQDFEKEDTAGIVTQKFDFIIGNPPYLRIPREHPAACSMSKVVCGAPNLYFLFAAMSLFNLKDGSEMVYIIPRSWTSGAYFKAFRSYFLTRSTVEHIHLFVSRSRVFGKKDHVLQETMIVKAKKAVVPPDFISITSTHSNNDFQSLTSITLPYVSVFAGNERYVLLPTSEYEAGVMDKINKYDKTLPDIGVKMKTGIIVDFRQREDLRRERDHSNCPLFYSQHIRNGRVNHQPSGKEFDWVTNSKPGLVQRNKDYIFCKRFTAKEERRRLQCGIYLASDFPQFSYIGTQNKINFVESTDGSEMDKSELYGIFALLNSTLFDVYYRILNGSTQVNSTEINHIPVPPVNIIREIGSQLISTGSLSTSVCDAILSEVAYG